MGIEEFLGSLGMGKEEQQKPSWDDKPTQWEKVIQPNSSYLIVGDVGTGKSALAYWILEAFSKRYDLLPAVVGIPKDKRDLLPPNFVVLDNPSQCAQMENAIVFIDEADLQLPIEDTKARQVVVNFLSLPRHRKQIFLLAFHFPRLVLGRYLPFFAAFLLKRPPYLIEFASKRQNDTLATIMQKAEERFAECPDEQAIRRNTYVVAPRIRWQGMLENGLCSFWTQELSEVWAGTTIEGEIARQLAFGKHTAVEYGKDKMSYIPKYPHITNLMRVRPKGVSDAEWLEIVKAAGQPLGKPKKPSLEVIMDPEKAGWELPRVTEEEKEKYSYSLQQFNVPETKQTMNAMIACNTFGEEQIRRLCVDLNLSDTGHSLILCARVIAKAVEQK